MIRSIAVRTAQIGLSQRRHAFMVAYPKCGGTYLRFLVVAATTGRPPDYDSVRRDSPPLKAAPRTWGGSWPRLVKTHEPPQRLRSGFTSLHLVRDPVGVANSYLNYLQNTPDTDRGDAAGFEQRFLRGGLDRYGSWGDHVGGSLERIDAEPSRNLLIRYEDLVKDPSAELAKVLSFLEVEPRASFGEILEWASRDRMRNLESTAKIMSGRTGSFVGDRSRSLSPAQAQVVRSTWPDICRRLGYSC